MVTKRYCDVCGEEIPESICVEHNKATQMWEGHFSYGAVVVDEMDDLCKDCGRKVRDFIRLMKMSPPRNALTTFLKDMEEILR